MLAESDARATRFRSWVQVLISPGCRHVVCLDSKALQVTAVDMNSKLFSGRCKPQCHPYMCIATIGSPRRPHVSQDHAADSANSALWMRSTGEASPGRAFMPSVVLHEKAGWSWPRRTGMWSCTGRTVAPGKHMTDEKAPSASRAGT